MRRAPATVLIGFGAAMLAAPVCAQSQPASSSQAGLRRLDWSGKAEPRPADSRARPEGAVRAAVAQRPAAPNRYSARVAPAEPSRVWNPFPEDPAPPAALRPALPVPTQSPVAPPPSRPLQLRPVTAAPQAARPAPPPAPRLQAPPAPLRPAQPPVLAPAQPSASVAAASPTVPVAVPAPAPIAAPVQAVARDVAADAPPRSYADFSRPVNSAPAATAAPASATPGQPISPGGVDLTPPRSYADFSRPVKPSAGSPAAPPRGETPRYYSVHREYGRQPEQPAIPEAFFIDSVGGEDLAAPPEPLMSDRDERRARAAAADPDASQP